MLDRNSARSDGFPFLGGVPTWGSRILKLPNTQSIPINPTLSSSLRSILLISIRLSVRGTPTRHKPRFLDDLPHRVPLVQQAIPQCPVRGYFLSVALFVQPLHSYQMMKAASAARPFIRPICSHRKSKFHLGAFFMCRRLQVSTEHIQLKWTEIL